MRSAAVKTRPKHSGESMIGPPEDYYHRPLPLSDLSSTGILWLLNRQVFHPRGFALAIHPEDGTWELVGDGTEVFAFEGTTDDEKFAAVERFLGERRR